MYDYKTVKSFWTNFFKDWQEDVKTSSKEVFDFWSKFFKDYTK
jgi:cytoplasmic iron level regulating protein YaaA (DUF328/UPF0246 family)